MVCPQLSGRSLVACPKMSSSLWAAFQEQLGGGDARLLSVMESALTGKLSSGFRFRPLLWEIALGALARSDDKDDSKTLAGWVAQLSRRREEYANLKATMMSNPGEDESDPTLNNPLSFSASSRWASFYNNQELVADITKDIDRLFPEGCSNYFHTDRLKALLTAVLFVWCATHPDVSYRQVRVRHLEFSHDFR